MAQEMATHAARREVEESYVRQLQRLTKRPAFSDPSCIPIEFRGVCERLVAEIAEVAHAHTALEQRMYFAPCAATKYELTLFADLPQTACPFTPACRHGTLRTQAR